MSNLIEKKLNETGSLLNQLRKVQEEKANKYDSLLNEQESKIAEAIADIEELRQKHAQLHSSMNQPGINLAKEEKGSKELSKFLRNVKAGQAEIEVKELRTDIGGQGGYAIQSNFSERVIKRIYESSPIRQYANIEQTSTDHLEILIDTGEAEARWTSQGSAGAETTLPLFEKKKIDVYKLEALPVATVEATQDPAINLEEWLIEKVADKFARSENAAFVTGSGSGQPTGFLSYPNTTAPGYEYGKIEQINSGVDAGVSIESLINLQNALNENYQTRARWFMSRTLFTELLKLKGADEYYFLSFEQVGVDRPQMALLGKPVTFFPDMPDPTTGSLSVAYADFKEAYTIIDRVGINILRDPYSSKGNVIYYTTKRVGGDVVNFDAIKLLSLSV